MSGWDWMVDFDGVLADHETAMVKGANERFSTNYTVAEITHWDWWKEQPKEIGNYVWGDLFTDEDWFLEHVEPYEGAIEALVDLATNLDGVANSVRVITARIDKNAPAAVRWLEKYLPPTVTVPFTAIGSSKLPKSHFCKFYRLNAVVEDHADQLRTMNAYRQHLFLVDRPWNSQELLAKVMHVDGLAEAVQRASARVVAA
jgi:hypothetical protein